MLVKLGVKTGIKWVNNDVPKKSQVKTSLKQNKRV